MIKDDGKHYNIDQIRKIGADYNMLLSERGPGKSFQIKWKIMIREAFNHDRHAILLRRFKDDIQSAFITDYFRNFCGTIMEELTDGEYNDIIIKKTAVYFAKSDGLGNVVPGKLLCYLRALANEQRYKSGSYDDVDDIVFEEFISTTGYLAGEVMKLSSFVSTVARDRKIHVWMVGNKITRVCPYYTAWSLTRIAKQKPGTIDIYRHNTGNLDEDGQPIVITIAVENCAVLGRSLKMMLGINDNVHDAGGWETTEQPHLPKPRNFSGYDVCHEVVIQYNNLMFFAELLTDTESGCTYWYIQPKTSDIKQGTRIVSDHQINDIYASLGFRAINAREREAFRLLLAGYVYYSDNLTGTDFQAALDGLKRLGYN